MIDYKRIASQSVLVTRTAVEKLLVWLLPQLKKAILAIARLKPRDWLVILMGTLVATYLACMLAIAFASVGRSSSSPAAFHQQVSPSFQLFVNTFQMCAPVLVLMVCLAYSRAKWQQCPAVSRLAMGGFSLLILTMTHYMWHWWIFGFIPFSRMDYRYYLMSCMTTLVSLAGYVLLITAIFWSRVRSSENRPASDKTDLPS